MPKVTAPYCLTTATESRFADFISTARDFLWGFLTRAKKEVRVARDSLDDIYNYAEQLSLTVAS